MTRITKAVFPVGGLGTRLLPATKAIPKEMLPIVNKPIIQYAAEEAIAAGVEELIFVTGRGKATIEDHFDESVELDIALERSGKTDLLDAADSWIPPPGTMAFVRQRKPLGLGHAVLCAERMVGDEPFVVLLADELIVDSGLLERLIDVQQETGGNVVAVTEVGWDQTNRYGIVDPGNNGDGEVIEVEGVVEKPPLGEAPSRLALIGRYALTHDIFSHLGSLSPGAGGEVQLTDALATAMSSTPLYAYRYDGDCFDCGSPEGIIEANVALGLGHADLAGHLTGALRHHLSSRH